MKYDIQFDPPITNAAGTLGFAPDVNGWVDLTRLGGFFTNPVSWHSRSPSQSCCSVDYPGGFLIHSGVPNPGLRSTIRQHRMAWERSPIPVVVHLLCQELSEVRQMVSALEGLPGVSGLELGLPPNVTPLQAGSLVNEAIGELPVIVRLPFNRVVDLAPVIAAQFPLAAISLGPPRGKLPDLG